MLTLIIVLAAIVTAIHYKMMALSTDERTSPENVEESNGASFNQKTWNAFIEQIGLPLAQYCISCSYALYMRLTLINVVRSASQYPLFTYLMITKHGFIPCSQYLF